MLNKNKFFKIFLSLVILNLFALQIFADDKQENLFAIAIAPSAPFVTPGSTLDDELIYGDVRRAVISGDKVLLEMSYGLAEIDASYIKLVSEAEAKAWQAQANYQVITPFADVQPEAATSSYPYVITLPRGAYLKIGEVNSQDTRYVKADLVDGLTGWIRRPLVRPVRKWGEFDEDITRKNLIEDAKLYLGTAYRWGGLTPNGVDCSGMTHMIYRLNGLEIFRNSPPEVGHPIALKYINYNKNYYELDELKNLKPGDLIHWSGHVGMYLGEGKYIHANGKDFKAVINSLISGDEDFREDLANINSINTFGTAFPDEPDKLTIKEFYTEKFLSGDETGCRFYVRVDGYAPDKAIIYPEGLANQDCKIILDDERDIYRLVYSDRKSDKAPFYIYSRPGNYKPAVKLFNINGYKLNNFNKIISSDICELELEIKSLSDDAEDKTLKPASKIIKENEYGFVLLEDFAPEILQEIRYYSSYNFVGTKIDGYEEPCAILTREAAEALKAVNDELMQNYNYCLKVYDAYRPQRAVNHFMRWANNKRDMKMREDFYPEIKNKAEIFKRSYVARKSGHSRGSTVDLTIYDLKSEQELDMGGTFDYFGALSHYNYKNLSNAQKANRKLLRDIMIKHGFKSINSEWWHFTLKDEPYHDKYFDFDVRKF
ncbi:MAG: C40 family peptidase [Synergistaceae bacterium]|nr:C40 family peptidase [Synergistaceae bacterium]